MGRGNAVTAPDGSRWLVRRRWMDRPFPSFVGRLQASRKKRLEEGTVDGLWEVGVDGVDGGWAGIALAVVVLLVVFVLLPLLGVALELIAVIFILGSGVVGRVFFGRPWIVEAVDRDGRHQSVTFPVKGWRRAGEAASRLAREITVTGRPQDSDAPEVTRSASR